MPLYRTTQVRDFETPNKLMESTMDSSTKNTIHRGIEEGIRAAHGASRAAGFTPDDDDFEDEDD